jgi:ketosteroid isomerase-like protein
MKTLVLLFAAFSVAGCARTPEPVDTNAEADKLMDISRQWSTVAGSGDLEATLAYWADDAVMMAPGQAPLRGKDAIRKFVESSSAIPGFSIKWEPLEAHVSPSGEMAYLIERNLVSYQDSTGATLSESNKVVTVWRKQPDGSWKNVIDMWNADPSAWK